MKKRILMLFAAILACCVSMAAQQAHPLTFWSEYTVRTGKEDEFMTLVKAVGQPVRDKLMADGVVLAWGIEVPVLRGPSSGGNHYIWYSVADWAGMEKVQAAMQAQLAKLAVEDAKAGAEARKTGRKPAMTTAERIPEVFDESKTRDWLTRDLVFSTMAGVPPAGTLPYTRYSFTKAKPGKGGDYRKAWEKYNKPVFDKLVADGVIAAFGLAVEEVKTTSDFTHFTWYGVKDLAGVDKVRAAFTADRDRRSEDERNAIAETFASLTEPDAARGSIGRSIMFHLPGQK